jgi:hypothetical protein
VGFSPRVYRTWLNSGNIGRNGCWRLWEVKSDCDINHQTKIKTKNPGLDGVRSNMRRWRKRGEKWQGCSRQKTGSVQKQYLHRARLVPSQGATLLNCILLFYKFLSHVSKPMISRWRVLLHESWQLSLWQATSRSVRVRFLIQLIGSFSSPPWPTLSPTQQVHGLSSEVKTRLHGVVLCTGETLYSF